MIILAFDGVVADTLALRCNAFAQAIAQVGAGALPQQPANATIATLLPGRTFYEVARELQRGTTNAQAHREDGHDERIGRTVDETWCDLVAHVALQRQSMAMVHGVSLTDTFRAWRPSARAAHSHWVLRADSVRRDVERWLVQSGLEPDFRMVRCADDLPRDAAQSSIANSYHSIYHRSIGNRAQGYSTPGPTSTPSRADGVPTVVEVSDYARRAAAQYFPKVSPDTDAAPVVLSSLPDTR